MRNVHWARSRGDRAEKDGVRRGAWYPVVEDEAKPWVVVDVHHVEIRVPREHLEIRPEPPAGWSVVRHPYLVCPGCHARRYASGAPKELTCPECGNTYPIDWTDSA
jgi:hypothetical protein